MKDLRILAGLCILIASVSASAQTTESVSTDAVVVSDTLTTVPIVSLIPRWRLDSWLPLARSGRISRFHLFRFSPEY